MGTQSIAAPVSFNSAAVPNRTVFTSSAVTDCSLFAVAVALCRFAFRSHFLYDIDSVNFALALGKFDPSVHQPHPPGYFLYVMLGRLLNLFTGDANAAFVLISILASCGAVVMIYLLAANWFGRGAAVYAAGWFLFSPLAWFHGTVALTYGLECFFSAAIGYQCWRIRRGADHIALLAITLGIAAGFRPSSILFLGPLCLYAILVGRPRRLFMAGLVLLGVVLCWFIPMLLLTGGPARYLESLLGLWKVAGGRNTVLKSPIVYCIARVLLIGAIACLCFGTGIAFAGKTTSRPASPDKQREDRDRLFFTWIWITPGLLFFTFVFLLFVNSGYLLVLSPPVFAYLGHKTFAWFTDWRFSPRWRSAILLSAAVSNVAIFLFAPIYCSYRSVRQFEAQLATLTSAVRRTVTPGTSVLVGFDSHFLGYRHAAYYLPEYLALQYPALTIGGKSGVFAAQHRQTEFLPSLPAKSFEKFVLLPLPPDDEDRRYMSRVYSRFPNGFLQEQRDGGWVLAGGPIAGLKYLFAQ